MTDKSRVFGSPFLHGGSAAIHAACVRQAGQSAESSFMWHGMWPDAASVVESP